MKINLDTFLLKTTYLMIDAIVVFQSVGAQLASTCAFYCVMLMTSCFCLKRIVEKISKPFLLSIYCVDIAIINIILDLLLSENSFSQTGLIKIVSFTLALFFFSALSDYPSRSNLVQMIFDINSWLGIYIIVVCVYDWSEMHLFNGYVTNYLTLRFTNPNLTALFLTCCTMMELIHIVTIRKNLKKLIHILIAAAMFYLVWNTKSRNCIILIVLFLLGWVASRFFFRKNTIIPSWISWAVALFPIVFTLLYVKVVYNPAFNRLLAFAADKGKELDSRYTIWNFAWNVFLASPIIGSFNAVFQRTSQVHVHNSHLDILSSYGLVVLLLFCFWISYLLKSLQNHRHSRASLLGFLGFIIMLLTGIGEAAVFTGGLGIYAYVGAFIIVANWDQGEES